MRRTLILLFLVSIHLSASEWEVLIEKPTKEQLVEINNNYLLHIKPIFKEKCLDCHGKSTKKPWYYILPGIRQFMDHDMREAKEHMDMSEDFPFTGHGSPKDDLEAILNTLTEESMPPLQYRLVHWSSHLTNDEKKQIRRWIQYGQQTLKGGTP